MLRLILAARSWHLLVRLGIATAAVAAATALQLPIEIVVPGEPYLLNFIVVVAASIFLGPVAGFLAAAETSIASLLFLEPPYSLGHHAVDLLAIVAYAIVAVASTQAFSHLVDSALAERLEASSARHQQVEAQTRLTAIESMARSLAESEARFRATFENAAVGVAHFRPDGRWLRVNDAMCRILGWPADELLAKSFQDVTHPDDLGAELDDLERLRTGKVGSYAVEKRSVRKGGAIVWIRRTVSSVRTHQGAIDYFVSVVEDISEQKRAEQQLRLLMREANHRAKNILSLVQAIARQTDARDRDDFIGRFTERLQALAANQDLLVRHEWQSIDIEDLVRTHLAPFASLIGPRITIRGSKLHLNATASQALGLAIHELATNASKYGALSTDAGHVEIDWLLDGETLVMNWVERGGPPVRQPERQGFGTTVTGAMVKQTLEAEVQIDFAPSGLAWRLACPAANARDLSYDSRGHDQRPQPASNIAK